jgi:pyruvate/2-oxoglutarate dehydrogenase complex dihydrolipoamide acyltransferase (E2) component
MAETLKSRVIPLSTGRRLVGEWLHHARKVPSLPLARDCQIAPLVEARSRLAAPPSWTAILMKAYGLVARDNPELRRMYLTFPYRRLYEHDRSECALIVEREYQRETVVLAAKFVDIERKSLAELDGHINFFRTAEVWSVSEFRQLLRMACYPTWVRRFGVWRVLNWSGPLRARRAGTFSMSSLGNFGVEQIHPLTPLTTYFTFGPIQPDGRVTLKIIYDHRVMDGRCVSRALVDLENAVNTALLREVQAMIQLTAPMAPRFLAAALAVG